MFHSIPGPTDLLDVLANASLASRAGALAFGMGVADWVIVVAASIASFTDLRKQKIYNALTFTVMLIGFGLQAYQGGLAGLGSALSGIGAGLLLLGWLFVFGVMGAGDVKLLMAFGAVGGARYCLDVALLSLCFGVVLAFFFMLREKKVRETFRRIGFFFLTLIHRELTVEFPTPDARLRVPYGLALGVAAVSLRFGNPLAALGVLPW